MKKLQSFDTLKYLLALCVILGHMFITMFPHFYRQGGAWGHIEAYAVDGFFLISGFFLAKSCLRISAEETEPHNALKKSVINRIKRLAPEMLFGAILTAVAGFIIMSKPINWEILPFNMFFLGRVNHMPSLFGGMWYISVLFWVSTLLCAFWFYQKRYKVQYIILPAIILGTILFIAPNVHHLIMHGETFHIFKNWSDGWFKGLLEISLGMETYFIAQYFESKKIKIKYTFLLELLGLFLVLHPLLASKPHITDFMLLPGYMILIVLLYLKQEHLLKFMSWKPLAYITGCSYMLFILNGIILGTIRFYGGYKIYPVWMVALGVIIGGTIISLIAQKLCAKTVQGIKSGYNYINNVRTEKIIKIILYTILGTSLVVAYSIYYNKKMISIDLNYHKVFSKPMYLNDGDVLSKDFKILYKIKLNHINCRFFTWKNEYQKQSNVYFGIQDETNNTIMQESVNMNDIHDNDVLKLKTNVTLKPGKYKFVLYADKTKEPFAVSVIKTYNNANYYINNNLSDKNNDIQCVLTH